MSCKLNHKEALLNSREFLIEQQAIDKLSTILNLQKFEEVNSTLSNDAFNAYGVEGNLWSEKSGRAVPNKSVLKSIDEKRKELGIYDSKEATVVSNIKPGVDFVFEQNPELANTIYKSLGFNQLITPNDKIVFGHPTIGKSFLKNQGENKFISLDDDYANEINEEVKKIALKYSITTYQVKDGGVQKWNTDYNRMMQEMFDIAKQRAFLEKKTLFTSNTNLLKNNIKFFDKVINLTDIEFEKRIQARGAKYDIKEWKSQINNVVANVSVDKVIITDRYLSDLFLTTSQKQQAQQLYSKYLEILGSKEAAIVSNIKPGVDFVFEQNPELEKIGDKQQYSKYLETVFPESKVKEIAYHSTDAIFEKFKPVKPNFDTLNSIEGVYNFTTNAKFSKRYGSKTLPVVLNVTSPIIETTTGEFVDDMDRPLTENLFRIGKHRDHHLWKIPLFQ